MSARAPRPRIEVTEAQEAKLTAYARARGEMVNVVFDRLLWMALEAADTKYVAADVRQDHRDLVGRRDCRQRRDIRTISMRQPAYDIIVERSQEAGLPMSTWLGDLIEEALDREGAPEIDGEPPVP